MSWGIGPYGWDLCNLPLAVLPAWLRYVYNASALPESETLHTTDLLGLWNSPNLAYRRIKSVHNNP